MTKSKSGIDLDLKTDVLDILREWIDKNLPSGRVKTEIFVRNHKPYRFTLRTGDVEVGYEIGDKV